MKKIFFAPIQGATDDAYRRVHNALAGGIDSYFTPFIRIEGGKIRNKDFRDIKKEWNEGVDVVPQVIARDITEFNYLVNILREQGYSRIDINMGCPFTLQTRHGRGAGLMTNPDKLEEILSEVKKQSSEGIQFSLKMRIGLNSPDECRNITSIINDTPLQFVTVHPRLATQQYKGDIDLDTFNWLYENIKHPIVYNGDIKTIDDINRIDAAYPRLHAVMIGRGLLARPTLATEYKEGNDWDEKRVVAVISNMHTQLYSHYSKIITNELQLLNKMKSFWEFMEPTLGKKRIKKISKAGNLKNYLIEVNCI